MYLHLLSNASHDVFPNNKMGDFSTILATPLTLEGEWEIGLSEINIPGSFLNVSKEDAWFRVIKFTQGEKVFEASSKSELSQLKNYVLMQNIDDFVRLKLKSYYMLKITEKVYGFPSIIYGDKNRIYIPQSESEEFSGKIEVFRANTEETKIEIESKHYTSIKDLIDEVNVKANNLFKLTMDSGKVSCNFESIDVIQFSPQLGAMLGFRNQSLQRYINHANFQPDLTPGINAILVYTDIIEESYVGDVQAPLLRLLPRLNVQADESMSYECFPMQYKKILQHEISR